MLSLGSMGLDLQVSYIIIGAGLDLHSSSCFLYCTSSLFHEGKAREDGRMWTGCPVLPEVPGKDLC